ncbi:MAG: thioredoxin family protein [Afipia sp.]|nr:thioredoxin family protein [Afipia sp.]
MEETTGFPALADTCEFVYMYHMIAGTRARTFGAAAFAATLMASPALQASELVMFEQPGCVHCQRWNHDVGSLYGKTDEARALPLRRVDIRSQGASGIALASPVRYTPTFVVVDDGREVGRITGYSNDEAFWGLLTALAAKLPGASRPHRI